LIALAALIISALGLWNSWSNRDSKPAVVVEKARSIPLALRGKVEDDGKTVTITPIEPGHALDSLTVTAPGRTPVDLGSEPSLSAAAVEALLPKSKKEGTGSVQVKIEARYIEAGFERRGGGRYRIDYRWVGGGLFEGRSLRLTRFSRG
jgi:hypothetical protein